MWKRLDGDGQSQTLGFEERLALMVDHLYTRRQNLAFEQRLKRAKLKPGPCVEDIDYRAARGLDKGMRSAIPSLAG